MREVAGIHHEQSVPDACIAACACMILRLRGEPADEATLHGDHAGIGVILSMASTRRLAAYAIDEIRLALGTDEVVTILVHGPPYIRWQEITYPDLRSRHGKLCAPGEFGGPLHAVLLVDSDQDGFFLLDPYFPSAAQPLYLPEDALELCFAGQAAAAAL
jgi:hypothetical protein